MKRLIFSTVLVLLTLFPAFAQAFQVKGPQGGIAMKITLPDGFDPETGHCPMVLLMHGIFSSKDYSPMPQLAKGLAAAGIASIRFDFDGHGKSEGKMQEMTVEKELADARAVWDYVRALPFVTKIGLLGHSQGGVIASMTAGRLAVEGAAPDALVLLAPGSVIKDACRNGKFFNARFNPSDPPEYIRCWGVMKLGREYLLTTQELDIYGTAASYEGPVLILHGDKDTIVPLWCSEKFRDTYGNRSELVVVAGENHLINRRRKEVVARTVSFFEEALSVSSGGRVVPSCD